MKVKQENLFRERAANCRNFMCRPTLIRNWEWYHLYVDSIGFKVGRMTARNVADIPLHACCIHVALIIIHAAGHYHFRDDWRPTSDRNRTCVADCSLSHAVINALLGLSNDAAEYVAMKVGKLISRESVRGCAVGEPAERHLSDNR